MFILCRISMFLYLALVQSEGKCDDFLYTCELYYVSNVPHLFPDSVFQRLDLRFLIKLGCGPFRMIAYFMLILPLEFKVW